MAKKVLTAVYLNKVYFKTGKKELNYFRVAKCNILSL